MLPALLAAGMYAIIGNMEDLDVPLLIGLPAGIYLLPTLIFFTSQNNLVDSCCFDYGNAETDSHDDGNGTMEAVYFGGGVVWGTGSPGGHNNGPWVMADLENGLFSGVNSGLNANDPTVNFRYTTAIVKGPTGESVVLLSGELPADLTDASIGELLDLAAAVLSEDELALFDQCLAMLRRGEGPTPQRIEINGAVLTVYRE